MKRFIKGLIESFHHSWIISPLFIFIILLFMLFLFGIYIYYKDIQMRLEFNFKSVQILCFQYPFSKKDWKMRNNLIISLCILMFFITFRVMGVFFFFFIVFAGFICSFYISVCVCCFVVIRKLSFYIECIFAYYLEMLERINNKL